MTRLLTFGHGTATADELVALLEGAGAERLVDVRTAPGSRRHPHVRREAMAGWLGEAGVGYRWEPELGGFRRPDPGSVNTALRHPAFRGYADYMRTPPFWVALERLLAEAAAAPTTAMCSETLWWRCHRRLLADAAVLVRGAEVLHLDHRGRLEPHRPTDGVRRDGDLLVYDLGSTPPLPEGSED
ncbi:MAG TPA: DUF488 domain-containing protein [Actinomycetes bacterium]|nr:DUF488 domain-containing protein [Actinomycetes bacterium]